MGVATVRIPNKKPPRSVGSNLLLREQLGPFNSWGYKRVANLGRDKWGFTVYIHVFLNRYYTKTRELYGSFVVQVYGKARMG